MAKSDTFRDPAGLYKLVGFIPGLLGIAIASSSGACASDQVRVSPTPQKSEAIAAAVDMDGDTRISQRRLRVGETTILTVDAAFPPKTSFWWDTTRGGIAGKGRRVNFMPDKPGQAVVGFRAIREGKTLASRRFVLQVDPPSPQLVIDRVLEEDDGRMIVHGHAKFLPNPEDYNVAVYVHGDVYYNARGRHVYKVNYKGRFAFAVDVSPVIDRLAVHLVKNGLDLDGPEGCYNAWDPKPGLCSGEFDEFGLRVPLKIKTEDSLAYAVHYFVKKDKKHPDKQIQNLLNRFVRIPMLVGPSSARLLRSYPTLDNLYLYDQALAILAFTHAGEQAAAKRALDALHVLQIRDGSSKEGSWYFSYDVFGSDVQPGEDRRVAGAIGWMAIALNAYRMKFRDPTYDGMWHRVMKYLAAEMVPASYNGIDFRAVRFQGTDSPRTQWKEPSVLSVEHNLDAYSAFRIYAKLTGKKEFAKRAEQVRAFLRAMWVPKENRFYAGYDLGAEAPNTSEFYKDTQSWGLLALGHNPAITAKYKKGLDVICENFMEPAGYVRGRKEAFPGFFDWIWIGHPEVGATICVDRGDIVGDFGNATCREEVGGKDYLHPIWRAI